MAGNTDAVTLRTEGESLLKSPPGSHTAQLHSDCDLANASGRAGSAKQRTQTTTNSLDFSAPVTSEAPDSKNLNAAAGKPTDSVASPAAANPPISEENFLKMAPDLYRTAHGLPKDASSKELVDKIIKDQIHSFDSVDKGTQKKILNLMNVDKQTSDKILAHNKDSERKLADVLLKQERAFLEIPPTMKGADAYKAIEKGMEQNDYKAVVDARKIQMEMSNP